MARSVLLIALGGTISMQGGAGAGITPKLSGADLLASVPGLSEVCAVSAQSPFRVPGVSLTVEHVAEVARLIEAGLADGHDGAVVVQGTDTIEETAYLLDLLVDTAKPVAVTGAMRGADQAGADGPANILAAATYAASDTRDLGTVVVFNEEIHAARFVRKADTGLASAFTSAPLGPVGRVSEGRVRIGMRPAVARPRFEAPDGSVPAVALAAIGFGEDGKLLPELPRLGYAGAVIIGLGAGHVPESCAAALKSLAQTMPVVLATRVPGGPVFTRTYGFAGSEIDLLGKGLITSGDLGPAKARLLLQLALAEGHGLAAIRDLFVRT